VDDMWINYRIRSQSLSGAYLKRISHLDAFTKFNDAKTRV